MVGRLPGTTSAPLPLSDAPPPTTAHPSTLPPLPRHSFSCQRGPPASAVAKAETTHQRNDRFLLGEALLGTDWTMPASAASPTRELGFGFPANGTATGGSPPITQATATTEISITS